MVEDHRALLVRASGLDRSVETFPQRIYIRTKPSEAYKLLNIKFFDQCPSEGEVVTIRVDEEKTKSAYSEIDSEEHLEAKIETYVVKKVKSQFRFRKRSYLVVHGKPSAGSQDYYSQQSRRDVYLELITTELIGTRANSS